MVNPIEGENTSETWLIALDFIVRNGKRQGGLSREILSLVSVIRNPMETSHEVDQLFRKYIGAKWVAKGSNCIFPITPKSKKVTRPNWSKNYWGRLTKYRERVDQLDFIVRRLQNKPHSKQLSCVTFDPEVDIQPHRPFNPSMPCMIAVDIKLRNGKLNLFAMFRSYDFGRKAYGNYIGLGKLLNMLSNKTGYDVGEVVCYSVSAHVRTREFDSIKTLLEDYRKCTPTLPKRVRRQTTLEICNPA